MEIEALVEAVECGDLASVRAALAENPELARATTTDGDTLLHIACWQKRAAIVRELLAHSPDVNARGDCGRTPLHYAVHEGDAASVPIVGALLVLRADPGIKDDHGSTVAEAARCEMDVGLEEVLALLRNPPRDGSMLDTAAEIDAREPLVRAAAFRVGSRTHHAGISAYRGRDQTTGAWTTVVQAVVAVPTSNGGTIGGAWTPKLELDQLARFGDALSELRANSRVQARFELAGARSLRIAVTDRAGAFHASCAATALGPPGTAPLALEMPMDQQALSALVEEVRTVCAAIAAWSAADRRDE